MIDSIKYNIDKNFYLPENRSDFFVDEKRKKIWAIEIDLYKEFERVCNEHNIKFCVFAGTMLGAVRHNGFIPWDDDFDVCMDRENYNKFIKLDYEFKHPYFLQHALNDREFFFGYARLRNSNTTGVIRWNYSKNYNNGIYIDIYVLDGCIKNKFLLSVQILFRNLFNGVLSNYYKKNTYNKNILKKFLIFLGVRFFKYEQLFDIYNYIISFFNEKTKDVALMTHDEFFIKRYHMNHNDIQDVFNVKFEMITVNVPKNYDYILKNFYSNYLELPSIDDIGKWHDNIIYFCPDIPYEKFIVDNKYDDIFV